MHYACRYEQILCLLRWTSRTASKLLPCLRCRCAPNTVRTTTHLYHRRVQHNFSRWVGTAGCRQCSTRCLLDSGCAHCAPESSAPPHDFWTGDAILFQELCQFQRPCVKIGILVFLFICYHCDNRRVFSDRHTLVSQSRIGSSRCPPATWRKLWVLYSPSCYSCAPTARHRKIRRLKCPVFDSMCGLHHSRNLQFSGRSIVRQSVRSSPLIQTLNVLVCAEASRTNL